MKVEIKEQPQQIERKYPYVGECVDMVVLFVKEKTGFVLIKGYTCPVGYFSETWKEENFTPLPPNSVTITI